MIAKTSYGSSFKGALLYGEGQDEKGKRKPGKSELLHTENLASVDARGMAEEMKAVAKNHRVKVPVMHTSLSWKPGEMVTSEQMIQASLLYCEKMGAKPEEHQIVIFRHFDQAHPHCHIYINRVPLDRGNAVAQSNDYLRNTKACREITRQLGFEKLEEKKTSKGLVKERSPEANAAKQFIHESIKLALRTTNVKSFAELKEELEMKRIEVKLMENKNGVSGISFRAQGFAFKGQDVNFKTADLRKQLEKNQLVEDKKQTLVIKRGPRL